MTVYRIENQSPKGKVTITINASYHTNWVTLLSKAVRILKQQKQLLLDQEK